MAVENLRELGEGLLDYLDHEIDRERVSTEEETGRPFTIRSMEQANWALRKIARLEARRQECWGLAETETARIGSWLKGQEESLNG